MAPAAPVFTMSPAIGNFAKTAVGYPTDYMEFTVTNTGTAPMRIPAGAITLVGSDAFQFDVTPDSCDDATVAPGDTCTLRALFSPSLVGAKQASLRIETNAADSPHLIALSGTAMALSYLPNPVPDLDPEEGLTPQRTPTQGGGRQIEHATAFREHVTVQDRQLNQAAAIVRGWGQSSQAHDALNPRHTLV